ncbi:MAG TPA: hypothetical protein VKB38_13300 [Terracidiphilus sp.]|nr:hypothetical protein [Terracidiphilus sp.]
MPEEQLFNRHHRKPKSLGGTKHHKNISWLPIEKHRAWHFLFQNWPPERIAEEINRVYLDPSYRFVLRRR